MSTINSFRQACNVLYNATFCHMCLLLHLQNASNASGMAHYNHKFYWKCLLLAGRQEARKGKGWRMWGCQWQLFGMEYRLPDFSQHKCFFIFHWLHPIWIGLVWKFAAFLQPSFRCCEWAWLCWRIERWWFVCSRVCALQNTNHTHLTARFVSAVDERNQMMYYRFSV